MIPISVKTWQLAFSLALSSCLAAPLFAADANDRSDALVAFNSCASKYIGKCDFYRQCVEQHFPCGEQSYALAFGQRYCEKFDSLYSTPRRPHSQSRYLAGFVIKTRSMLQRQLISYINTNEGIGSCQQLEDFAFSSHSEAYVQPPFGICHLFDIAALRTIIATIDDEDLLRPQLWRSSFRVASHCAKTILGPLARRLARPPEP